MAQFIDEMTDIDPESYSRANGCDSARDETAPDVPESARLVLGVGLLGCVLDCAPDLPMQTAGAIVDRVGAMLDALAAAERVEPGEAESGAAMQAAGRGYDLVAHLYRQRRFSVREFGPGARTEGVCRHIEEELREIREAGAWAAALVHGSPERLRANAALLEEWIDVALLAFDGAWRAGFDPSEVVGMFEAKLTKNEGRDWPDWRTQSPDAPIEHDRSGEAADPAEADAEAESGKAVARSRIEGRHDPDRYVELTDPDRYVELTWNKRKHDLTPTLPGVLADLVDERHRQIEVEGFTLAHDDKHSRAELARAAAAYALAGAGFVDPAQDVLASKAWPFGSDCPTITTARNTLIKAGALIVAEIERLDRADAAQAGG